MSDNPPAYPQKDLLDRIMDALKSGREELLEVRKLVNKLGEDLLAMRDTQNDMQECLFEVKSKTSQIPDELNVRLDRIEQSKKSQDKVVTTVGITAATGLGGWLWNLITKGHTP